MDSTEFLSRREIRARLRQAHAASDHLNPRMSPSNPHNAELRFRDISDYVRMKISWLTYWMREEPPKCCRYQCPSVNECRKRPACRDIDATYQRRLSDFFKGWDSGTLVKARIGDKWQIVPRNASLAQVASPQGPPAKAIKGRVELTASGPRLKL